MTRSPGTGKEMADSWQGEVSPGSGDTWKDASMGKTADRWTRTHKESSKN